MEGLISSIHRCSRNDGPGLRTTVFVQGCHLRCHWCHNPETWPMHGALGFHGDDCLSCGQCQSSCQYGLHEQGPSAQPPSCHGCGDCSANCPSGALEWKGHHQSVDELIQILEQDRVLLSESNGGLTLSGGEPFDQPQFTTAFLKEAQRTGFHTLLDTSLHTSANRVLSVIPHTDLFFVDWKCSQSDLHQQLTGVSNEPILKNLKLLKQENANVHLRCPLVPGVNDSPEHFEKIAQLRSEFSNISQVEFLSYHRHGQGKSQAMGMSSSLLDQPSTDSHDHERWLNELHRFDLTDTLHSFSPNVA